MKYAEAPPPKSIPCGTGNLVIQGPTGAAGAEAFARLASRGFISAQVSRAVEQALLSDAGLADRVAALRDPSICYTLGPATELSPESWSFPFEAFISDGDPAGE